MIWEHLDPKDQKKAKRSLITIASITIAVASVEIISDEITLLGFSLRISQDKLVSAGQLLTLLLLCIFALRSLPVYVESISKIWQSALDSKHKRETINLQYDWGYEDYPDFSDGAQGDFEALDFKQRNEKERLSERLSLISIFAKSTSVLLVDYTIPILLSAVAVVAPDQPAVFF